MPNRIKELRKKHNMLQDTLARLVGTTQQTISKIENGKVIPSIDIIINIANVFNVSIDYLLCRTNEEQKTLDYGEILMQLASKYSTLLTKLEMLEPRDVELICLTVQAMMDRKQK